jgi:hypothetical protein
VPFTKRAELTALPQEPAVRVESWLTALSLLAGVPILFDRWGLSSIKPLDPVPPTLLFLLVVYHYIIRVRPTKSQKPHPEIQRRLAVLRTHRALALGLAWWSIWSLENGRGFDYPDSYSTVALLLLGFSQLSLGFVEAGGISAWRRPIRRIEALTLLAAAGFLILPLSIVALTPGQGILLTFYLVAEISLAAREPRVPEAQP